MLDRFARTAAGGYAVLTYHRVDEPSARPWLYPALLSATPSGFEEQMAALATYAQPIGLPELLAAYRGDATLPRRAVLVTFDDAYRDFRERAWPVLKRRGIPVTLFVPTAYPGDPGRSFWWDRLWNAVVNTEQPLEVAGPGTGVRPDDRERRRTQARSLIEAHKRLPYQEAMKSVDEVCGRSAAEATQSEMLSWAELRSLAEEGVHVAGHSHEHPLLTRLDTALLRNDLERSRKVLESELPGKSYGSVLAYPGGQYDGAVIRTAADVGIELAFTTERGANRISHTDRFRLRRINVGMRSHPDLIRAQLAMSTLRNRTIGQ